MSEPLALKLGADAVQMLLPHRRPFLLVDAVDSIDFGAPPSLRARKHVSANEPVFEGHFPGLALWPGVYTIEGLGQTTNLLDILLGCLGGFRQHGAGPEHLTAALRAMDARARRPGRPPGEVEGRLIEALGPPGGRIGYAGAIDVKLVEPVYAGDTLEYRVTLTHVLANAKRFDVEARVGDRSVARGSVTSAYPG